MASDPRLGIRWPHAGDARRAYRAALLDTRAEWEAAFEDRPTATSALFEALGDQLETFDTFSAGSAHKVVAA